MKYNSIINLFSNFRYRSRSPAYHSNSNYRGNSDYRDDYRDDRRDDYRGGRDSHRDSHRRDYDHDGRDRGRGRGRGRGNCKKFPGKKFIEEIGYKHYPTDEMELTRYWDKNFVLQSYKS